MEELKKKYKIEDLLNTLPTAQVGLIVYSNEPFQITPLSDGQIASNLLSEVNFNIMPENGDRLDRAINLAIEKLQNASFSQGNIVVFSADAGQGFEQAIKEAEKAKSKHYQVSIINVNSEPTDKLKLIAQKGGGLYLNITPNDSDIRQLATRINDNIKELRLSENLRSQWLDYGYYLLLIPLLGCLYFFRKGIVWCVLFFVALTESAFAGFFINSNQEALEDYNVGDYVSASEKFIDARWKGASYYKQGKYEQALQQFSLGNDTTSLYNQGNALAKAGKIEEAIKKYEEVLSREPQHEDAKFNLEYLKQQQSQSQQNQQNDSSDSSQEQNQDEQNANNQPQNSNQEQQSEENNNESGQPEEQQQSSSQNNQEGEDNSNQQQEQVSEQQQAEQSEDEQEQQSQSAKAVEQEGEKFDEQAQARALRYRDIPENTGGLLKAFINKEYMKKRYNQ